MKINAKNVLIQCLNLIFLESCWTKWFALTISSYFHMLPLLGVPGVFDNCSHSLNEKGWSVGIRTMEPDGNKDARFYFTLRTDRAVKSTTVFSHQRYRTNDWTHLMATYNGHNITLYVDGAKVCGIHERSTF